MATQIPPRGTRGAKGLPSGVVARAVMGVARRVHRLTGSKMGGRPLLYLTTIGAKSGERRTAVVMPFPDGPDAWMIVASRGGTADHPAWYYNLVKHPDRVEIEIGGPQDGGHAANAHRRGAGGRLGADHPRAPELRRIRDQDRSRDPGGPAHRPLTVSPPRTRSA